MRSPSSETTQLSAEKKDEHCQTSTPEVNSVNVPERRNKQRLLICASPCPVGTGEEKELESEALLG